MERTAGTVLVVAIVLVVLYNVLAALPGGGAGDAPASDDAQRDQRKPDQRQLDQAQPPDPKPTLETATLYVAGSNGGAYEVSWTIWNSKGNVFRAEKDTGVIKEEPTAYPINLEGFGSDQNENRFMRSDIDMQEKKTEPWKGELVLVLKVNDTLVECGTTRKTNPRGSFAGMKFVDSVDLEFDADSRKDYKENAPCADRLES